MFACNKLSGQKFCLTTRSESNETHHAHNASKAATVATTDHAGELRLDEQLHHCHRGAVDDVLLVSGRCATRGLEELGRLGHCHPDQFRLRVAATAGSTTRGERLESLIEEENRCQKSALGVVNVNAINGT